MHESLLLADAFGGMFLNTLSRVLHTVCGATLLGGAMYMRFVLAPAVPAGDGDAALSTLFAGRRKSWALCVAACSGLLLLSGAYNFVVVISNYEKMPPPYHALFGVKFLVALAVMIVAAMVAGRSSAAQKMQRGLTKWLNILVLLVVSVFVLGAWLKNLPHVPKGEEITSEAPAFAPNTDAPPIDADIPTLPGPGE